jgi:tetratricopeptide (TPR) repeat protein
MMPGAELNTHRGLVEPDAIDCDHGIDTLERNNRQRSCWQCQRTVAAGRERGVDHLGAVCRVGVSWTVSANPQKIESTPADDEESLKRHITERDAKRLLELDLSAAKQCARAALEFDPRDPQALFLLGAVLRREGQNEKARAILQSLVESQPHLSAAWRELGIALARLGERKLAVDALLRTIDLAWMDNDAWYALGDLLTFPENAKRLGSEADPRLAEAKSALRERQAQVAESILRDLLRTHPQDEQAFKLLADILLRTGRWPESMTLLARCLQLAPDFTAARFRYAITLFTHGDFQGSLPHIDELLKSDPGNVTYRALKALALTWSRQFDLAIAEFESFIDNCEEQPGVWLEYARLLRATRKNNATAAYKKAFQILPSFVEGYVSLAHSKSIPIDETVIDLVHSQLARADLGAESRAKLHFVLGKAFEDLGRYAESFENYRSSNEIFARTREYGIEASNDYLRRAKTLFTPEFFRARGTGGCTERGAIFIVGMPRSGSTLVEQIISSHSAVEALGELRHLQEIASQLASQRSDSDMDGYPYVLKDQDKGLFRAAGKRYMVATRSRRRLAKPYFTDKMPHNYIHTGLVHLALPNAKIIDVRRHPLDCGWSCFKHYFPAGQPLTLDLKDIGRAYANYVELMAHFDEALPGKIYRVNYEQLINDFEPEVRRLLDYLGLPFEENCLRFHENERFVMTVSADQVRMPLYKTGVDQWRHYEQWLGPLKEELGHLLDIYPNVPRYYPEVSARWTKPLSLGHTGRRFNTVKGLQQVPFEVSSQLRRFPNIEE